MVTTEQATQYLESQGITAPDFVIDAWVESANSIQGCLDTNYAASVALMIQLYLIGLFGLANMDRYISSQTAPSGASRSFRYQGFADRWRGAMALLRGLDTHDCATGLIPPDPTQTAHAGLWIGKGGCMAGSR